MGNSAGGGGFPAEMYGLRPAGDDREKDGGKERKGSDKKSRRRERRMNMPGKAERQSNLELLRIIAMLFIAAGHLAGQGGILWGVPERELLFVMLAGSGLRIAVNLFLMIGVWFMVDAKFNGARILKLYGVTAFYSFILTLLAVVLRVETPKSEVARVVMPFFGRPLWFSSAYISLIALSPFLRKILDWEQRELGRLVLLLFLLLGVVSTVPGYKESYVADCCWCWYLYLFIGYMKKSGRAVTGKRMACLAGGLGSYLMLVLARWFCTVYQTRYGFLAAGEALAVQYISDIRSVPNFFCALCVFLFFLNTDMGTNKIVNYVAGTAFGVYVIHSVPAFHDFLWHGIYKCDVWKGSGYMPLYFTGTVLSVYVAGSVIDRLRMRWIEPIWVKSRPYRFLCMKMEEFYNFHDRDAVCKSNKDKKQ